MFPAFSKPSVESPAVTQESAQTSKVNLNQAKDIEISKQVKGIGKKRAEAIVNYREKNGPFDNLKALSEVKGISKKFVSDNWDKLESAFRLK
jgi:competence protein ComEA